MEQLTKYCISAAFSPGLVALPQGLPQGMLRGCSKDTPSFPLQIGGCCKKEETPGYDDNVRFLGGEIPAHFTPADNCPPSLAKADPSGPSVPSRGDRTGCWGAAWSHGPQSRGAVDVPPRQLIPLQQINLPLPPRHSSLLIILNSADSH